MTGSSGFIGRWVSSALHASGATCIGIDTKQATSSETHNVDILDEAALREVFASEAPDYVIHLAARCDLHGATLEDYKANIEGVRSLCRVVSQTASVKRVIYTSSQLVCKVGHVPEHPEEYCPDTVYGASKVRSEKIVRSENGGGVEWCITRPTTAWGPGMGPHYRQLLRYLERGRYFHSGEGALYKSYGYVENMAHQYVKLLEADSSLVNGKTFYLADYEPLSLRNYIDRLALELGARRPPKIPLSAARTLALIGDFLNRLGFSFPYNSFRLRNIRTEYIFDMSATRNVCGELPRTFDEGIRETVRWYKETERA